MKRETPSEGEPAGGPAPTTLVDIVFPGAVNHHGTLFGGAGLAFMDRVAFVAATRHGRVPFVTASCERVDFRKPAHIGEIAVGCALGYLDFRYANLQWREGRPAAAEWFAAFDARPAMAATRPRERTA
ncbi:MAG: hypothetical protein E2577_12570 [Starkeya sp.]|nr:hypothetical protein [Starkeya sp.]